MMPARAGACLLALMLCACGGGGAATPARIGRTTDPGPPLWTARWQSELDRDHPLVGRIVEPLSGRSVGPRAVIDALAQADVVVLGEKHDNPDHHVLQARVIESLSRHGRRGPVVFEQLELADQSRVDAYLREHPGDAGGLGAALDWKDSGWPAYSMYLPVFRAALDLGGGVRAGSMDRETTHAVSRDGLEVLQPSLVKLFRLDAELPAATQESLRSEMRDAHCGMLPEAMLDVMITVQRARDATLAEAVLRALHDSESGSAVLVTGNGHARADRGVPADLRAAGVGNLISLGLLEVRSELTSVAEYGAAWDAEAPPFDYVAFTPRASDADPCEALRGRFDSHGERGATAP
jgi:uncharacterized iron-regulated protein